MDGLLVRTVSEWFIYQELTGQPGVQILRLLVNVGAAQPEA